MGMKIGTIEVLVKIRAFFKKQLYFLSLSFYFDKMILKNVNISITNKIK